MYRFIKSMYDRGVMTAAQVWSMADSGKITEIEAITICGPRPKEA